MMRFASLGSGSKGNATLIQAGSTLVLVDCGFSLRETTRRLSNLGVDPGELDAVLVTHEHTDHSSGVASLSRKHRVPVYLTHGTAGSGRCDNSFETRCFNCGESFELGALSVTTVPVPHDAREPCQYLLGWEGLRLGILTDLGSVTPHVVESYRDCDSLLLEFNHDLSMLHGGNYPPALKRRVGGDWGHLNNEQAVDLLRQLDSRRLRQLVVAHVSENNNCEDIAREALSPIADRFERIVWAQQATGFDWLAVSP
jgi:phosphoribosyl 1,2-cyclic phosphodiesterase